MRIDGPPVTADTLFQAASISKPVAALAALKLVQSGKLDLDADVNRYLKSWRVAENSFTAEKKVTLRGLLTHTAGLTVHGFPGYASDAPVPSVIQILNGQKPANTARIQVDTVPGTIWRYSGGGYVVAQVLLEEVTGQPFVKLMQDTVLGPIGMTRSTYQQPLPNARLSEVAMPYRQNGEPVAGGPHVYPEMAPAGLWTTPSDLARYAIDIQQTLAGASSRVIDAAMARRMLTPTLNRQGLGPRVGGATKRVFFAHGGANEGYRCNLVAYTDGDGLVVMTNSDSGGRLANDIMAAVAREYGWPDFQR
jgi:CubicO group peptidase (beta-lactamase class C family)